MIKYNKKCDNPVKFRFVVLTDNDNILEVLYETSREYDGPRDPVWRNTCYHKVIELNERYDFDDYENCPKIEIQICCNGVWKFHKNVIDYWFSL